MSHQTDLDGIRKLILGQNHGVNLSFFGGAYEKVLRRAKTDGWNGLQKK